ncbi:hypothetical protein QEG46_003952 [Stenotrophomonas maltophilia]|nr:hypothetical protein [Stenotrophomonas maltophilia]
MTTDNKTLAVDVLAVMEHAACALEIDARREQAGEMASARAAVAELIEALRACDRRLHDLGFTVSDDVTAQVIHALARVKGESA